MRRSFVTLKFALALSFVPVGLFAQAPEQQPPAGAQQPPAGAQQPAQPEKKEPRLPLTGPAGAFLYQIKADQTGSFEELLGKVKDALGKSENPIRKQQLTGWKVYKAAEPAPGGHTLYVFVIDPAVPATEYDLFMLLAESLGAELAKPEVQEMFKKYQEVFVPNGTSRLTLTPTVFTGGM